MMPTTYEFFMAYPSVAACPPQTGKEPMPAFVCNADNSLTPCMMTSLRLPAAPVCAMLTGIPGAPSIAYQSTCGSPLPPPAKVTLKVEGTPATFVAATFVQAVATALKIATTQIKV
jgi:hypothetical protein